jgi:hypothetical protein
MSPEEIAAAEDAVRGLLGDDVVRLLRPVLLPEHAAIVERIDRLPWAVESLAIVADTAMDILERVTMPGGLIDPKDDDADVPWAFTLRRIAGAPEIGARLACRWFALLERLLWRDAPVSSVVLATSAYLAAYFEEMRGRDHEVWRWLMLAAIQTELDERVGLGLVSVIRVAKLIAGRT